MSDGPLDATVLATLRSLQEPGTPDILTELIDLFLEDAPPRLAAVRDAVAGGDTEGLRSASHALKSSAANLGIQEVAGLASRLEGAGRSGDLTGAETMADALGDAYARAETALRALRVTD
jgi:two-component system sensor histidine kinase/response regulator